jgi:hypothetical protein
MNKLGKKLFADRIWNFMWTSSGVIDREKSL